MNESDKDELRVIVQTQIIECLNRFYAIESGMWGGPLDSLIIRTVVVGQAQGKLYDLTSLAFSLGLPLSTIHRKALELESAGFITRKKVKRSTFLQPTEKTCLKMEDSFNDMMISLQKLYSSPYPIEALKSLDDPRTR